MNREAIGALFLVLTAAFALLVDRGSAAADDLEHPGARPREASAAVVAPVVTARLAGLLPRSSIEPAVLQFTVTHGMEGGSDAEPLAGVELSVLRGDGSLLATVRTNVAGMATVVATGAILVNDGESLRVRVGETLFGPFPSFAERGAALRDATAPVTAPASDAPPREAEDPATPSGIRFVQPRDLHRSLEVFWPCPHVDDEFEEERCRASRPARLRATRQSTIAALAYANIDRYDFARHRFVVAVGGVVGAPLASSHLGSERAPWDMLGSMLVTTSPFRDRGGRTWEGRVPGDWLRLDTAEIRFDDDARAEAWRAKAVPGSSIATVLLFRPRRTWASRIARADIAVLLCREMRRAVRVQTPCPTTERMEGVLVEPIGWVLVGPLPENPDAIGIIAVDDRLRGALGAEFRAVVERELSAAAGHLDFAEHP